MKFSKTLTIFALCVGLMLCSTNVFAGEVCYDKSRGLDWYAGPDEATSAREAKLFVESLSADGGGWRLPTSRELSTLFKKGAGSRNIKLGCIKTTGWAVWSSRLKYSTGVKAPYYYDFMKGHDSWYSLSFAGSARAFAVRKHR